MNEWLAPAVIAAVVSGGVQRVGLIVAHRGNLRLERSRREEKIIDFLIAIRAEVQANVDRFRGVHISESGRQIAELFSDDPAYTPFVPRYSSSLVFEQILKEIHLLPNEITAAVVRYYKAEDYILKFVDDLRDAKYAALSTERRSAIHADYIQLLLDSQLRGQDLLSDLDTLIKAIDTRSPSIARLRAERAGLAGRLWRRRGAKHDQPRI